MFDIIYDILDSSWEKVQSTQIGKSREGRPVHGYHYGSGRYHLSLIAGCHADEPTGPRLLRHLVNYLSHLSESNPLLTNYSWWIVPHANPDGEAVNRSWYDGNEDYYDLARYLRYVSRELPGDDVEFGFQIDGEMPALRPENQAIFDFWKSSGSSFDLHISLHGMSMAQGPWFLIEPSWTNRSEFIMEHCTDKVLELNYRLYDVDRRGEKGFWRIARGFCTRPDAGSMRAYFNAKGEPEEAKKFHASSMESIRSLGGDCLTLVSEMPLFILPSDDDISWPNTNWAWWKKQFMEWKGQLLSGGLSDEEFHKEVASLGLKPMAVRDQMILQWHFFWSGVEQMISFNSR